MRLLLLEQEIAGLWNRYHRPDKATWEREWTMLEKRARVSRVPWLKTKHWQGRDIDYELREGWMERLNAYAEMCGALVISTCAGHPHGVSGFGAGAPFNPDFGLSCNTIGQAVFLGVALAIPNTSVTVELDQDVKHPHRGVFVKPAAMRRSLTNTERLAFCEAWWESVLQKFCSVAESRQELTHSGFVFIGEAALFV